VHARFLALILGVAVAALVVTSTATAKEFRPGDLRICSHRHCVAITNRPVLKLLGAFYYSGQKSPPSVRAPHLGAPAFELRFRNGYVTGIVATPRLDRFLSYGVYLGRFARGTWYRFPASVAQELRRLAAPLSPLYVTRRALARSR
jgi:hypothetical protein